MNRALPPHPSFEQLKKQAKDLRKEHQSASAAAAAKTAPSSKLLLAKRLDP